MNKMHKLQQTIIAIKVGEIIIIKLANQYANCDNIDDAECILDQMMFETSSIN